jgi:lipid-binding SYLF domain-containing protein
MLDRLLLVLLSMGAFATLVHGQRVRDVSEAVELFQGIPEVQPYFENAYGYAVWPRIGRGGLGIGASRGRGQVYVDGELTGFSTHTEISVGLQAGGQTYRQIVFFEDQEAYQQFTAESFEFDASAQAVAVTASAEVGAGTQGSRATAGAGGPNAAAAGGYQDGMQIFTMAEGGLMYKATIAGQRYSFEPAP